jgi:adenylate cyclase
VRLVHLYVHEPLMRAGVPSVEIAEEMEGLTREVLPFAAPFMNYLHGRLLAHFVEQDMIGHMEGDLGEALEEGRLRVAIAFADLAGYARLTVERGDEVAVSAVERFVEAVAGTLPADARVIKTLGDEVMVIGSDPAALAGWAVDLASGTAPGEPLPRIGLHYGEALYRDGDYYGREVNQAARVVARAGGGEVLVTRPVVDMAAAVDGVEFDRIGEVRLKGFSEPTELFTASRKA